MDLTTTLSLESLLRVDGTRLVVGLQDIAGTATGRVTTRTLLLTLLTGSGSLGAWHLTGGRLGGRRSTRRGRGGLRCLGGCGRGAVLYEVSKCRVTR